MRGHKKEALVLLVLSVSTTFLGVIQFANGEDYPAGTLISWLSYQVKNRNWTEDMTTAYAGYVMGALKKTDVQNLYDRLPSADWDDCLEILKWSSNLRKLGIFNETKEKTALNNTVILANHLPKTTDHSPSERGLPAFWLNHRFALTAYALSQTYGYLPDKWNLTEAYKSFNSSVHNHGEPISAIDSDGIAWGIYYGPRFYDEAAETIDAYLTFYDMGVEDGLTQALHYWNITNEMNWNATEAHYWYASDGSWNGYECEGGAFTEIVWKLWEKTNGTAPYLDRLETDLYSRLIGEEWASPSWQFDADPLNRRYAMFHYTRDTYKPDRNVFQTRLPESIESWAAIMGSYAELNETGRGHIRTMLSQTVWKEILDHSALYDSESKMFKMVSDGPTSNAATCLAAAWLVTLSMVPLDTTVLAVPYHEDQYPTTLIMIDPDLFSIDISSRTVDLSLTEGGDVTFFLNSPVTEFFSTEGHYRLTFSADWNEIARVERVGEVALSGRTYHGAPSKQPGQASQPIIQTLLLPLISIIVLASVIVVVGIVYSKKRRL